MKEDLQIEKGAGLADVKAPENLATDRARKFVSEKLMEKEAVHNRTIAWWGLSFALAACVALAVVLFKPQTAGGSFEVMQEESIHAGTASVDSTALSQRDSLKVDFELPAE